MASRLKELYLKKAVPALEKEFGYKNPMAVPKLEKVSINIGMGEATQNAKLMDGAVGELGQIAGQRPVVTKARKSVAAFKLRTLRLFQDMGKLPMMLIKGKMPLFQSAAPGRKERREMFDRVARVEKGDKP